ncbi:LuxR C-terminal-related transcriptional regulator [Nocardia suismassiliense]|uniref:LuxR C-terminal-related transcriptional regulator n=1 Tax=Nocardia suismassiliense TaxID=2077092 RepID=UPI00131F3167|nr:LuxR C-terminal-related transcriptional regulator [Nocardia suismassiliense]
MHYHASSSLSRQEFEMLRALSTGSRDEVVARTMNVSVRTMRRRFAEIMDDLQAHTRFQAGFMVARSGWLPSYGVECSFTLQDSRLDLRFHEF